MADGVPRTGLPERIGRYRILRNIGSGAMGIVYAAEDEKFGRTVAVKVLMGDLESNPETRARFEREARAAAGLDHRNIIAIFDAGQDHGRPFIVMQLLEGEPLQKYLPAAASLERKLDLMVQICEGLAAAHSHGVIHRDLKPSNLFVEPNGLLKILDFGVARIADSSMTIQGTMLGTPDYMSPEQGRGEQVDERSDVYSVGAVFYFMLSGRKPLPGPTLAALFDQLQKVDPEPLGANVPAELAAIVAHAMAKDPAQRVARIEDLLTQLVRFRRQYQAETRKLVLATRARYEAAQQLLASLAAAESSLGLPADDAQQAALRHIEAEFPPLGIRGQFEMATIDRDRALRVMAQLDALVAPLTITVERYQAHVADLEAGSRALANGDVLAALHIFTAVDAAIASPRAQTLAESARPFAIELRAREEQVAVHIAAARAAIEAREPAAAVTECRTALSILPGHDEASSLLAAAEHLIERERRRIERIVEHLLQRVQQALDEADFVGAERALQEAEAADPDSRSAAAMRSQLSQAQAAMAAAEELHELSAQEIRRARGTFRRGGYDEAIQQLQGFLEEQPDGDEVRAELDALADLRDKLASAAAVSRRRVKDLTARAAAAHDAGDIPAALPLLREAVAVDPTDIEAAALLNRLSDQYLKERLAREEAADAAQRRIDVQPVLDAARHALQTGYVALALQAAQAAQRILPKHPDILPLVEQATRQLASDDDELIELSGSPFPEPLTASPDRVAPTSFKEHSHPFARAVTVLRHAVLRSKG